MNKKIIVSLLCINVVCSAELNSQAKPEEQIKQPVATKYPKGPEFQKFRKAQQEFKKLSEKHGVKVKPGTLKRVRQSKKAYKAAQSQFDIIRSTLNTILKKDSLTAADKKEAQENIEKLREMGAQFWPGPDDYENLLKLHK